MGKSAKKGNLRGHTAHFVRCLTMTDDVKLKNRK